MHTSRLIFLCNIALVLASIAGLCLASSLFDFIVTSRAYYTVPEQRVLINPYLAFWIFPSSLFSFILSFSTILLLTAGPRVIEFAVDHQFALSFFHAILMCGTCVLSSFVSFLCAQNAADVGVYAAHANPLQFQLASAWYYSRLRALVVISAVQCILNAIIVCVLYLGINCKYRTFIQVSQQEKTKPDIIEKTTTYFA